MHFLGWHGYFKKLIGRTVMQAKRLSLILALNLLGLILFFSWYLLPQHGFWYHIDTNVYFFFNHLMQSHYNFALLVAITNIRGFDTVSLLVMGALYYHYWRQENAAGKRKMLAIGITMLLTAVVVNQLGHLIPVSHPSPSFTFEQAARASQLTGIHTKDGSNDSFPGDHGMMLIIFACFMWRYFGLNAFIKSMLIVIIFSLPRLMSGAHWLSDITIGSLSVVLVAVSWWLLTDASDKMVNSIKNKLPWPRD